MTTPRVQSNSWHRYKMMVEETIELEREVRRTIGETEKMLDGESGPKRIDQTSRSSNISSFYLLDSTSQRQARTG